MEPVDLTKRLALIRYLYQMAERQAEFPLPTGAVALLSLHDCLEWFLITAGEQFGVDVGRETLLEDFDKISSKTRLTNKTTLAKVSSARKELKHRFTLPASSAIVEQCHGTKIFLIENTTSLFEIDFESISLKDMIQDVTLKKNIEDALIMKEQGDYIAAMHNIRYGYDRLTQLFKLNLRPGWPYGCGVDSLELFYFNHLIPTYQQQEFVAFDEACNFCLEFILNTAIKLEQQMSSVKIQKMDRMLNQFHGLMKRS